MPPNFGILAVMLAIITACAQNAELERSPQSKADPEFFRLEIERIANEPASVLGFQNRIADTVFVQNGAESTAQVKLSSVWADYQLSGSRENNSIKKIRFISAGLAERLADEIPYGENLRVSEHFASSCRHAIIGDFTEGSRIGRILWCTPEYSPGAIFEGIRWTLVHDFSSGYEVQSIVSWNGAWK